MAALTCEVGVTLARGVTPVTDEEVSPRPEYEVLAHLPHPEPALEPVMTVSVLWSVVRAETKWGSSLLASVP